MSPSPRRRRKVARPAEILDAALDVFAEAGFAAARTDDIARRAGVAKGTVYLYFATKEDLFREAARLALDTLISSLGADDIAPSGSTHVRIKRLIDQAAGCGADPRIGRMARVVISESHMFPDLARIWHDDVAGRIIDHATGIVADAQARGELRAGDPRLHVFSILGPVLMARLFHSVFGAAASSVPDLQRLADQHLATLSTGMIRTAQNSPSVSEPRPGHGQPAA